jgi:hypothetical protein
VEVAITVGSAVGGEAEPIRRFYSSTGAAQEAVEEVAGHAAQEATQLYASSLRLQALTGQVALSPFPPTSMCQTRHLQLESKLMCPICCM